MKEGFCKISFFLLITIILFVIDAPLAQATDSIIHITRIEPGNPNADDELIEFQNTSGATLNMSVWSLQVKSDNSATIQKKNFPSQAILAPGETYLIANKNGLWGGGAQMTYSSLSLPYGGATVAIVASTTLIQSFDDASVVVFMHYNATSGTSQSTQSTQTSTQQTESKSISSVEEIIMPTIAPVVQIPIRITELLPKPRNQNNNEFIELTNQSLEGFDAAGLQLRDAAGVSYILGNGGENTIFGAFQSRIWKRMDTHIALNDTDGEMVQILDGFGRVADQVSYSEDAPIGSSRALWRGAWVWSVRITPNEPNIFIAPPRPPVVRAQIPYGTFIISEILRFDASDTTDENDDLALLLWNFGDGTESFATSTAHAYTTSGTFVISLTATDALGAASIVSRTIKVKNKLTASSQSAPVKLSAATTNASVPTISKTPQKYTPQQKPKWHTGIVLVSPGALGAKKFLVENNLVETTTDRIELTRLIEGTRISFRGTQKIKSGIPYIQITKKDPISILNFEQSPEPKKIQGIVTETTRSQIRISGESDEFLILTKSVYTTGQKIEKSDQIELSAYPIHFDDNGIAQTIWVPAMQGAILFRGKVAPPPATQSRAPTIALVGALLLGFAILKFILNRYAHRFYHATNTKFRTHAIEATQKYARHYAARGFNYLAGRIVGWREKLRRFARHANGQN